MPEGYGAPETDEGLLAWETVEEQLVESLHYWMATTRRDGRPHVVPRWGAWHEGALYYDGAPTTIHARNAALNAACTLHIGDGKTAITLDGTTAASAPVVGLLGEAISTEIGRKYGEFGYSPEPDSWSGADAGGLMVFSPAKALAWFDFPNDLTRFWFSVATS